MYQTRPVSPSCLHWEEMRDEQQANQTGYLCFHNKIKYTIHEGLDDGIEKETR